MFTNDELKKIRLHVENLPSFEPVIWKITQRLGDGPSYYTDDQTRAILFRKLEGLECAALWDIMDNTD